MKKALSLLLGAVLILSLVACSGAENEESVSIEETTQTIDDLLKKENPTDEEFIEIAMELGKIENNYTSWICMPNRIEYDEYAVYDESEIIEVEYVLNHNGEDYLNVYEYAPNSRFESVEDFMENAFNYLSKEYVERYLSSYVGLHETDNIPAPVLIIRDDKLYKKVDADGVSHLHSFDYHSGEVLSKEDEINVVVRLYHEPDAMFTDGYIDYPLLYEDGRWKHSPELWF